MTLSRTLLIGSIITAAISVLLTATIIGLASFFISKDEIERQTQNQLVALREEQKEFITSYLKQIHHQVKTQASSITVREAAKSFITSYYQPSNFNLNSAEISALKRYYTSQFGSRYKERNHNSDISPDQIFDALSEEAIFFQHHFISANPNPLGEKDKLVTPDTKINYREVHETYHPEFRNFLNAFGYYDIFIIDAKTGDIVYSVFKELDFATSLTTGPFASSGLADAFKKVRNGSSGEIGFSPFNAYTPSYEDPAAFIASPIVDDNGETIAVLAFQMPIDKINQIMTMQNSWKEKGLGETGETYLVSEDFKAQSLSRFLLENPEAYITSLSQTDTEKSVVEAIKRKGTNIGYQTIRTDAVERALSGTTGFELIEDYRGVEVLSA